MPRTSKTRERSLGSVARRQSSGVKIDTQLFRDAFNASPIGIALEDLKGQPLFVNLALCRMLGFTEEEMLRKRYFDFFQAEGSDKDRALLQQLHAGSIAHYQTDKRFVRRDGAVAWGRLTISLLKGHASPLVLAMVEDITERKIKESRLQEYEKAVEGAEEMIAVVDRNYRYLIANRNYLAAHKLARHQVLGRSVYEVLNEGEFDTVKARVDECFSGKVVHFETRHWFAGLGERDISASYYPIEGAEGVEGLVGILQDITERKRAENALHASEERLRLAQQAARMGTFEVNLKTGVNTWTVELESVYGLPPGGFGRTQAAFYELVHSEDRAEVKKLVDVSIRFGQPARGEWRIIWPDGSVHWVVGRWQVFRNERGEPSRMVGLNADVTERKQAEAAMLQMHRKLLEAQDQERARIGRELHDDINQRLAMAAMHADELQARLPKSMTERIQRLKEQLVDISSAVQSISHELHPPQLEYLGILGAMKSFCRDFGTRRMINVDFKAGALTHPVSRDVALCLFRVLQEALHNAAKHSKAQHFEVKLGEAGNELRLIVSDRGMGFDVEAAMNKGGLGLTSMRERVRLISGTLSIQSKPGSGTTVQVRAPLT